MTPEIETTCTADDFRFAFRNHPAGVGVITADSGNGPVAMTASSIASVSLDPPTLVFSASALSSSTPTILEAKTVVVHMMSADQQALAQLAATSGVDRFSSEVNWDRLPTGEPYYPEVASWLRGKIAQIIEVGGSYLVVVEAIEARHRDENESVETLPLVYHNRTWHKLDESSKLEG